MNQDKIFFKKEGDNWFEKNKKLLASDAFQEKDVILKLIEKNLIKPMRVLEIGGSNGWRLNLINIKYNASCIDIDPSRKALTSGRKKFPKIKFKKGLANKLPLNKARFDLVIVNFVLHWIDRTSLLFSIAEIDSVVKDGGYLILGDFFPQIPTRVYYHHLPKLNLYTYKQDYARIFLDSGIYEIVDEVIFPHNNPKSNTFSLDDRAKCTVLRKKQEELYKKKGLNHA